MRSFLILISLAGAIATNVSCQDRTNLDYKTYVANLLAACRENRGGIFAFPELEQYYSRLFESKTIGVSLRTTTSDGTNTSNTEMKVYFETGKLYVRGTQGSKTTNYVSTDEGVYSWVDGEGTGRIFKSNLVDQAQYFSYLLDPSAIMKSFFHNYLTDKKMKKAGQDSIELEANVDGGIWNVTFSTPDLWFSRLLIVPPIQYSKPGSKSEMNFELIGTDLVIPPEVLSIPEGIAWKESPATIASLMTWL